MSKFIIQFNEANFDLIDRYCLEYDLKHIKNYLKSNDKVETYAEDKYENLEPWIQWYSFYTNKSFQDHKIFHLNEISNMTHDNFLYKLARKGSVLGIFGSMNLPFSESYKIYIPDPWSTSETDKSLNSKFVNASISQLVNENAKFKIGLNSILGILILIGFPKNFKHLKKIIQTFIAFIKKDRIKLASFLDYFFFKYSINRHKKNKLEISSIFLNGFAHIQHHYLLNSEFVKGKNPKWYYSKDYDPILDSLKIYDEIFELINEINKNNNLWTITGLSQQPYTKPKYYWRISDHQRLFSKFFKFKFEINTLMTRDFQIICNDKENITKILDFFKNSKIKSEGKLENAFGYTDLIDEKTIFSTFIFDGEIEKKELIWKNKKIILDRECIDFIAIKNGEHISKGWLFGKFNKKIEKVAIWDVSKFFQLPI
jgi:hypothetical protein